MRRKIFIAVVAVPILLALVGVAYLRFGDLGWIREPLERRVSAELDRRLTIAGRFDLSLLPSPRLVAEDITLANPDWSDEPAMVHVDRLELALSPGSLLGRRPTVVSYLRLEGADVRLERAADDRANWDFELGGAPSPGTEAEERLVRFERVELAEIELLYRDRGRQAPLRFGVDRLDTDLVEGQMFALQLDGSIDRFPVDLTGRITSIAELLAGEPLRYDLRGHVGRVEIVSDGEFADIAALDGPDLTLRVRGPDLETWTDLFGLPSLGSGSFELGGRAAPSSDGVELVLDADLVDVQAEAHGNADSLFDPRDVHLDVTVSGTDLDAAGKLFDWKGLPSGEFEASAELSSRNGNVTLNRLRARVGEHVASVEGVIRTSKELVDRDLRFEVAGPDLSAFSGMAGADLVDRSYELEGHLARVPAGIAIESLVGRIGEVELELSGTVDEVSRLAAADVRVHAAGPDLSAIRALSDLTLPPGPFALDGSIKRTGEVIAIDRLDGRAGDTTVSFEGILNLAEDFVGTDLRLRAAGRDPTWITPETGFDELPVEPYAFDGTLRFADDGPELDTIRGSYGDVDFELHGELTDLLFRISGPDVSWLSTFGAPERLPSERFEIAGRVRASDIGYELEKIEATLGDTAVELEGRLGKLPGLEGTDVELKVSGPRLSALSAYADLPPLPAENFAASGRLSIEPASYELQGVSGQLGKHRFTVAGTVSPDRGLAGTTLELELSGPDLADAGRLVAEFGVRDVPQFRNVRYSVAGNVSVDESGYELQDAVARVVDAEARVSGRLGTLPEGHGTDLVFEARGEDASVLATIGTYLPQSAFRVHGRVERDRFGARFHDVVLAFGDDLIEIDGTLGEPPRLEGTNLDLRASGSDLSLVSGIVDLPPLPAEPFELSAHFEGSPQQFSMRDFHARLGRSDLAGELRIDLRGSKPDVAGEFISEHFDFRQLLAGETEEEPAEPEAKGEFVLADEPLGLEFLEEFNADVRWTAGETVDAHAALGNVVLEAHLLDGSLTLDPVTAEGYGGTYSGALTLERIEQGYRVHATGEAKQMRLSVFDYSGDPNEIAPVDAEWELSGRGRSLHEIASSADGRLLYVQGSGRLDNSVLTSITADPLSKMYVTLNPFTKADPYTQLECSVALIEMSDGVARIGPMAMRTDKMVMLGKGQIDFTTEKLKLDWATKPRKGVGLSASAITNSWIKLGGTLSNPEMKASPLKGARDAGATVMTGGFFLLYKGLFQRVTAERRVCRIALKNIEKKQKKAAKQAGQ
ncbi:MAG: AsmA family protein [bacterium]|nr:AsmA family protein [bacterium]